MKLYASGEDYLEAILVLQKQKGMVRSVDSVCHAVATLKDACRIEHVIGEENFKRLRASAEQEP